MAGTPRTWFIRPLREGDEAAILDLARVVFLEQPSDRFSIEYWNWEFKDNSSGAAQIWVAEDNGRIVGHYAIVPRWFQVGPVVRTGSIVVDVMTHPDYRKQGMFVEIGRESLSGAGSAGIEFSYGFPIRDEVMPGHFKVGWRHIFDIPVLVRPLRFRPIVGHYLDRPLVSEYSCPSAHRSGTGLP